MTAAAFGSWYEKLLAAWCIACSQPTSLEIPYSNTIAEHRAATNTTVCGVDVYEKMQFPNKKRLASCLQNSKPIATDGWFQDHGIPTELAQQLAGYKATGSQVWRIVYNAVVLDNADRINQVPYFLDNKSCKAYHALEACQLVSTNQKKPMQRRRNIKRIGEKIEKMG